ncbi:sce7726 family protein [Burkholderia metallica]|uniref:sce7726 family protein n=1 Tax=Burkholderia metallica TaxID=488729 RepID=UPI001FC8C94E|nr:sce7726 family protein [Burkholderia metallica]
MVAGTNFCDLAMKTAPGLQWRPTYTAGTPADDNPNHMSVLQSTAPLTKSCAPRRTLSSAERLRLLARMFTRPVFADIARSGNWETALRFLAEHGLLTAAKGQPLASLFESAWLEIRRSYRNEFVYKTEIASRIVFGRHSPNTASLHVELPVGRSIVDVAVFNGTSTAYEIKTEFDTPRRLTTQTSDYLTAFDRVCLVTHPRHAENYAELVDPRVGVLVLTQRGSLRQIREPLTNRNNVSSRTIFCCLQKAEYIDAVSIKTGVPVAKPSGIIQAYCSDVFREFTPLEAHAIFVDALRKRKTDGETVRFVTALPESLRVLGYATPLSGRQRETALSALRENVSFQLT